MLIIQQRKSSICRTVLLIVLFQLTFVDTSISNQGICGSSNTRRVAYFEVGNQEVNWNEAWRLCKDNSSTLPVICNQQEQDSFTDYLKANITSSAAWIAGRMIKFNEWKWVDAQPFKRTGVVEVPYPDVSYTHVLLEQSGKYKAFNPSHKEGYLCQYSGSSCNPEDVTLQTNRCVRPNYDLLSWYDARNQCVKHGADLAILNDNDLVTLRSSNKLNKAHSYWIGLRKNAWYWMWQATVPSDDSDEEIKYSNWSKATQSSRVECISIDASNGEWKGAECTSSKKVVCQKSSDETMPSTPSVMTSTVSSTLLNTTTHVISSLSTSTAKISTNVLLYSGAGAGIVIIIICIIVIILAIRYTTRKPHKDMDQSKIKNNSEQNNLDLSPDKPATSPANASANAPVGEADDSRGLYAEISLATLNQREDGAKIEQPGIVYASLEFQREPTYLEPDKKRAHTTDATKVGPMGDVIYAMPDAKGHTATSSGNESASHSTKVTPQGDIYALPVKNSKSSTANSPGGTIYANL